MYYYSKLAQNVLDERHNYSLQLRKNKISDYFLNKRLKYKSNNEDNILEDDEYTNTYEVNIETLSLSDEIKEEYKKVNNII